MVQHGTFKALVLEQQDSEVKAAIKQLPESALPVGNVLVRVAYSDLNYKDGLAVLGKARVVRRYPMVPGIDLAGTVEQSQSPNYQPGDKVIATGFGMGETHWGGYTQLERVDADWLVPLPEGLTLEQAMAVGTAGLTAMLAVMELQGRGLTPDGREVIVTGATGGVGSMAVAILTQLGYKVAASTGSPEAHDYLKALGAQEIVERQTLAAPSSRPLESERWAGAIDAVGGDTLAGLLRSMAREGSIASAGNAGGNQLNTTVLPFILRGVSILGIDSNFAPINRRLQAWELLARFLPKSALERMVQVAPLGEVPDLARQILQGKIRGRVVIDVNR